MTVWDGDGTRLRLTAEAAERYVEAGLRTIVQDIFIGPMLDEVLAMFTRPLALVVLAPSADIVAPREADRDKTGYTGFTPEALDRVLRETTARRGLWLDTSVLMVEQTVDALMLRIPDEAVLW